MHSLPTRTKQSFHLFIIQKQSRFECKAYEDVTVIRFNKNQYSKMNATKKHSPYRLKKSRDLLIILLWMHRKLTADLENAAMGFNYIAMKT